MAQSLKRKKGARGQILALFSYLSILCLVPLMFHRDDEYIYFHARQGLVLWIWGVLAIFGLYLPVVGGFFFSVSVVLISVVSLIGVVSVLLGKAWRLPGLSLVADQL
ncbi:MAG: hypothetical protein HQL52_01125 [Magnetococcales bacterium]|nr:hypothetical protein [Magnetococcales bacterium]